MEKNEQFKFKSKLLKGKARGISAMIGITGADISQLRISDILALAGASSETPKEEIDEAVAELKAVFSDKNHPFWDIGDYTKSEEYQKSLTEWDAKKKAEWDALSTSQKVKYYLRETALTALGIFLIWVIFF